MLETKLHVIWEVGIVKLCLSLPATTLYDLPNRNWIPISINTIRKC